MFEETGALRAFTHRGTELTLAAPASWLRRLGEASLRRALGNSADAVALELTRYEVFPRDEDHSLVCDLERRECPWRLEGDPHSQDVLVHGEYVVVRSRTSPESVKVYRAPSGELFASVPERLGALSAVQSEPLVMEVLPLAQGEGLTVRARRLPGFAPVWSATCHGVSAYCSAEPCQVLRELPAARRVLVLNPEQRAYCVFVLRDGRPLAAASLPPGGNLVAVPPLEEVWISRAEHDPLARFAWDGMAPLAPWTLPLDQRLDEATLSDAVARARLAVGASPSRCRTPWCACSTRTAGPKGTSR